LTPKQSQTDKLKRYRKQKSEEYAQTILSTPQKAKLYSIVPYAGVVMIMGDIRTGKTGLAHEIANEMHRRSNLPAILHIPRMNEKQRGSLQRILPSWIKVTTRRSQWKDKAVVIYDEAAQSAHARRSQSGDAVELDELLAIAGQREQLILFISHYSRKLDLNEFGFYQCKNKLPPWWSDRLSCIFKEIQTGTK